VPSSVLLLVSTLIAMLGSVLLPAKVAQAAPIPRWHFDDETITVDQAGPRITIFATLINDPSADENFSINAIMSTGGTGTPGGDVSPLDVAYVLALFTLDTISPIVLRPGASLRFQWGMLMPIFSEVPVGMYGPGEAGILIAGPLPIQSDNLFVIEVVPEPSVAVLLALGVLGLAVLRWRRRARSIIAPAALLLLLLSTPVAQAAPDPIVFDFENGLQGWTLEGSAQRIQTGVLGGDWAIFGDGVAGAGASMSMEVDWTGIASITVEHFFISGNGNGLHALVLGDAPVGGGRTISFPQFEVVESGNPSLRTISPGLGMGHVEITWENSLPNVGHPSVVAFIDNITFHPVPEPSTLGLLTMTLAALLIARRRRV